MNRTALLVAILVLAFLGIADAWYLAQAALTQTPLICGIDVIDGCNTVAQSEYSRLLGIPLGLYGLGFYAATFALAAVALAVPARAVMRLMLLLSGLGLIASVYFLYLQLFVINALCIYCVASFVIAILLFGLIVVFSRMRPGVTLIEVPEPEEGDAPVQGA
jgi:uncharacterized membrane protein